LIQECLTTEKDNNVARNCPVQLLLCYRLSGQEDGQFGDGETEPIWDTKEQTLTS